jgi:hypothetical protein
MRLRRARALARDVVLRRFYKVGLDPNRLQTGLLADQGANLQLRLAYITAMRRRVATLLLRLDLPKVRAGERSELWPRRLGRLDACVLPRGRSAAD